MQRQLLGRAAQRVLAGHPPVLEHRHGHLPAKVSAARVSWLERKGLGGIWVSNHFVMISWNGGGEGGGHIFQRALVCSTHTTKAPCLSLHAHRYVYDRLTPAGKRPGFPQLLATQLVSGVWHGLYPGGLGGLNLAQMCGAWPGSAGVGGSEW